MWVADLTKCTLGAGPPPTRLILNVTRDGSRLTVIEVSTNEVGAYVAERQYVFKGAVRHIERDVGTAETAGHETLLRWSGLLDRWSISEGGYELVVSRRIGDTPAALQQRLILRRSSGNVE